MSPPPNLRFRTLSLETLEGRELPSAVTSLTEAFQRAGANGLPEGWTKWSSDTASSFLVEPYGGGLGDSGRLVSTGNSNSTTRAWVSTPATADIEASAAVYLQSLAPTQLFVRGVNLNTARPSYYAVSITRGAEIQLVRVVDGVSTRLGRITTPDYASNRWITIGITAVGDSLRVSVHRGDTNQRLGADGQWTRQPVSAIEVTDTALRAAGNVGFARLPGNAGRFAVDTLRIGPSHQTIPSTSLVERFEERTSSGLPAGWSKWMTGGAAAVSISSDETLRMQGTSTVASRAWQNTPTSADVQFAASIFVDSLTPAGIFARGSNLESSKPTYYSLTVKRGVEATLWKVVNGVKTELATIKSQDWLSGQWLQVSLVLNGDQLRVQLLRSDTGQYLRSNGTWGLSPTWAMTRTDRAVTSGGRVGVLRDAGYAGSLLFDNVIVSGSPASNTTPPTIPTESDKPTAPPPSPEDRPTPIPPVSPPVPPVSPPAPPVSANPALPNVPQHYDWIRLANLAYYGTPLTSFEQSLLKTSIDLVVPNIDYMDDVAAIAPTTPQFAYSNVSNIYLNLLTDWMEYADRNNMDREAAFYHANHAVRYSGSSASAVPVEQFWGVYRGNDRNWTEVTSAARRSPNSITFGDVGESVAIGNVDRFREINVQLRSAAYGGWASRLEYVSAVDSQGRPTQWKTLNTLTDTTGFFRRSGQITFDPPRDWVAASVGGSARLYYVRFRTTSAGTAPAVMTLLGHDYTRGNTIPAFDRTADRDGDGYLNDAEYARRRSGFNARFIHESRVFYPNYGSMRFATNVSNPSFRSWAVNYHERTARSLPLASGFFIDNSIGRLAIDPTTIQEPLTGYTEDYGSLLGTINTRLQSSGKWILANTAGANVSAEPISRAGVSYLEEFSLRPMTANHVQFDDLAATVTYRRQLSNGTAYEILDSLPQNIDINNPRMQLATLSMYYMIADPKLSFLMVNGGNEPASSWTRHWIPAVTYNVGKPKGDYRVFATGSDPTNARLTYNVYARNYDNALMLYKPLSYTRGQTGTTADATATTHQLDGWYKPLNADGSLGRAVRQITLRNGEGAILVKA